ncbi:hypothetical protein ACQY0O_000840 [Thecaphora frezii]
MKTGRFLALALILSFASAHASHHLTIGQRDLHRLIPRQLFLTPGQSSDSDSGGDSNGGSSSSNDLGSHSSSPSTSDLTSDTDTSTSNSNANDPQTSLPETSSSSSSPSLSSDREHASASHPAASTTPSLTSASPSATAQAAASLSAAAAASSSSAAAAASRSAAAAAASSSAAAAASSSSANRASASSASASAATATTTAPASSSTVFLTSTVEAPVPTPSAPTDAAAASQSASADSDSGGISTGLIIGVSVTGGVLILGALLFLYMKFGGKRFDGLDDGDTDIKWPELKQDPDSAAMQPLPARRTGGAGFDMGDDSDNGHDGGYGEKGRESFSGSTTLLSSAAPGYPVSDPHYAASAVGGMDAGYVGHQTTMETGQYYDMYPQNPAGAVPGYPGGGYNESGMQPYPDTHGHVGYPEAGYPDTTNPYAADPYAQPHTQVSMQNGQYRM